MRLCLFEDCPESLEPLSLTRPVFELRCGMTTLAQKHSRYFGLPIGDVLLRPVLQELFGQEHPRIGVNDPEVTGADDVILVNGRWLPPTDVFTLPSTSCVAITCGSVAYVVLRKNDGIAAEYAQLPEMLEHWRNTLPSRPASGCMIGAPWDLVERNADEIRRDFCWRDADEDVLDHHRLTLHGPQGNVWIAKSARVEPMVFIDASQGPVVIDEGVHVTAFTRLEGPCYLGQGTHVLGAKIRGGTSIGPSCRIGGEVEASIVHGYSNKYHDGFLGHSYVGEWVNLGAGTCNSDLRNDYGEVRVVQQGRLIATGMNKVGCFLGDHTKTGLGVLLNTGTSVGAFCNLLPAGRFAPKYVPSFTSWWNGSLCEAFTLEQLLATAEIVMQRRGATLTDAHKRLHAGLLEDTLQDRRRVLRESDQRLFRKSA